jgi:type II secretory pathway predicted ATPase ExeA
MNSEHLQLREDPFGASAEPRFLYEAESHSRAAATLITNVDGGVRLQVLVSAPGVGKSTLLYCLEESACRNANTVFIENAELEVADFLTTVIEGIGGELPLDANDYLEATIVTLLNSAVRTVLIIDDAQQLDHSILEILNVLIQESRRKLQVVMSGDIDLLKKLRVSAFSSLRLARTIEVRPIQHHEIGGYITHRLLAAGYDGPPIFDDDAVKSIYDHSRGVPAVINELCSEALAHATGLQSERVDRAVMGQVLAKIGTSDEFERVPLNDPEPTESRRQPERAQPRSNADDFAELVEDWLGTHAKLWVGTAGELAAQLRSFADPGSRLSQRVTSSSITGMIAESANCLRMMGIEAKLSSPNSSTRLISLRYCLGLPQDSAEDFVADEPGQDVAEPSRSSKEESPRLGKAQAKMCATDPVFTAEELAAVDDLLSRYLETVPDKGALQQSPQETCGTQAPAESPSPTPERVSSPAYQPSVRSRRERPRSNPTTFRPAQSVAHDSPQMTRQLQPAIHSASSARHSIGAPRESGRKLPALPAAPPIQQSRLTTLGVLGVVTIAGTLFLVGFLAMSFNALSASGSTDPVKYSLPTESNSRVLHKVAPSELLSLAKTGDSGAQYELGRRFANGIGTRRDNKQALKWLRKSAEWGHPEAQFQLARMLADSGEISEAYTWLALSATNGEPRAKDESNVLAAKLSGEQLADARFRTGQRFSDGLGVSRDYAAAYAWFRLANTAGSQEALERMGTLKLRLKPKDMEEVQRQYSAWLVTQQR